MGDKFIEMCNTLIHTLPIFSKIDISIKFESEPVVINIGDYIVTIIAKSGGKYEFHSDYSIFTHSIEIKNGKFSSKKSNIIYNALKEITDIIESKNEFKIEQTIEEYSKKIGNIVKNGKITIIYKADSITYIIEETEKEENMKTYRTLEIKIEKALFNYKEISEYSKNINSNFDSKDIFATILWVISMLILINIDGLKMFMNALDESKNKNQGIFAKFSSWLWFWKTNNN